MITVERIDNGSLAEPVYAVACEECEWESHLCYTPELVSTSLRVHLSTAHYRPRHTVRKES